MRWSAVAVLLAVGCGAKEVMDKFDESKRDLAKLVVQKIATEAYPQWSMTHPEKQCPDKLDDLGEYIGDKSVLVDPWNHPYVLVCGDKAPKGVKGAGALSLGPDGQLGTADDIKSWE